MWQRSFFCAVYGTGIYELYQGTALLKKETMDFQIHLYKFGEREVFLKEAGFTDIKTYASFGKDDAVDDKCEIFLFECSAAESENRYGRNQ